MKLLIDIPEHIYEHAKETTEDSRDEFDAMRAIANGTRQESRSEIPNTCGDAISRQAVLEGIRNLYPDIPVVDIMGARRKWLDKYAPYFECENVVEQLPSVTPQAKTGHWIEHPEIETSTPEYLMFYECSECGDRQCFCKSDIHKKRFCSNCGCRMDEPQESEEKE